MQVAWYWPIVLFVAGSLAGGLLFGLLDVKMGQLGMSMLAFVGWPASAASAYLIIHDIHPYQEAPMLEERGDSLAMRHENSLHGADGC